MIQHSVMPSDQRQQHQFGHLEESDHQPRHFETDPGPRHGNLPNSNTDPYMDQLAKRITRRGGMTTFTLTGSIAILGAIVFLNHVEHLVALFLKCASLISLLMAWYWISAKDDCRAATDALFMAGLKAVVMVCCCFCSCPQTLKSWAETI